MVPGLILNGTDESMTISGRTFAVKLQVNRYLDYKCAFTIDDLYKLRSANCRSSSS